MDVKILVIVYGCLSANLGNAANLVDAVNAARSFDTDMAAAREGQQAGHEKRWQGIAGFLPSAQLDGGYNKNSQPGMPYGEYVQKHNWSASS